MGVLHHLAPCRRRRRLLLRAPRGCRASPNSRPGAAARRTAHVPVAALRESACADGESGGRGGGAGPGGRGGRGRRHCRHGAARRHDRRLVPPQHLLQHLQQAGSPGTAIAAPLHHHRLPARLRLARHLLHVGRQAPSRAQALRRTAGQDRAAGRRAHAGHGVHQHEPGHGGRLLHAHRQGLGAVLHRPALRLLPRRGAVAAGAGLAGADRRRRRPGVADRGLLQLGRVLERHGVESAQPDQECAQQAPPRRRRGGGVHGRHKPLLGDHRAVLPAVLPSDDLRRGGQVLPSVPPEHRPESTGAVREGSPGRPLLPWLPEAVVHDPGEGVARDPLRGQLRQACGGHRLLRPLLPDAHLACQCTGNWGGTGGSLPVLQAQESKAKEFMKMFFLSCFGYRFLR